MNWIEARQAIQDARNTMSSADGIANDCADILEGRLRRVNQYKLARLKRELRDFNIHTGKWKEAE